MFTPEMSDEQKREILLEMNLEQTEAAIKRGEITEEDVERLLGKYRWISDEDRQTAIEQLDRLMGEMQAQVYGIEYHPDGSIKSIGGVAQGVIPIPDEVARKVLGDLVPPAASDNPILSEMRDEMRKMRRATEKVVDLLADILKELKRRK